MSTMNERAHEILRETTMQKVDIKRCLQRISRTIKSLKNGDCPNTCPFPVMRQHMDGDDYCITCSYYYVNKREPPCGCILIQIGSITRHQAICGLHRFSIVIKNYLKKKRTNS